MFMIHLIFYAVINIDYTYAFILILIAFVYFPKFQFHLWFCPMINIVCFSLYAMISLLFTRCRSYP